MVKKIVQRVIVGVLVSLILSFIYSLNSHAMTYVQGTTTTNLYETNGWQCMVENSNGQLTMQNATITLGMNMNTPANIAIAACETKSTFTIKAGSYYEVKFSIIEDYTQSGQYASSSPQASPWVFKNNEIFDFVGIEQLVNDSSIITAPLTLSGMPYTTISQDYVNRSYKLTYRAKLDRENQKIIMGDNTGRLIKGSTVTNNWVYFYNSIVEFEGNEDITQFLEQDKAENEQQGQQSQDDANSSQEETDQKTQNLLGFLGSFFGAFTSASASNCNLDWGMSEYGFGVVDMCSTDIPVVFTSVLSIITLLIVLPMVLWLIHSIINAFKEFQE